MSLIYYVEAEIFDSISILYWRMDGLLTNAVLFICCWFWLTQRILIESVFRINWKTQQNIFCKTILFHQLDLIAALLSSTKTFHWNTNLDIISNLKQPRFEIQTNKNQKIITIIYNIEGWKNYNLKWTFCFSE